MILLRMVFILAILLCVPGTQSAQHRHDGHLHQGHGHDPHKYHLGIGVAATRIIHEKSLAPGFHLHLIRQLGEQKRWGLGVGYEAIVDEHWHNGLNLLFNFRPVRNISLLAGPGLVAGRHESNGDARDSGWSPAFHSEVLLEFNLLGLHVGPMAGFGVDRDGGHFSGGVHIGLGF